MYKSERKREQSRKFKREEILQAESSSEIVDSDAAQLQQMADSYLDNKHPIQKKKNLEPGQSENNTGLPDNLKSGIENLSGHSMDDVKVHYNSDMPAQLNAHAYAQGNQIHIAQGQEKHLPHEAWHVVQQKQGRVKQTMEINGAPVNDNAQLEKEADVMGAKSLQFKRKNEQPLKSERTKSNIAQKADVIQRWQVHYRAEDGRAISSEDRLSYLPLEQIRDIADGNFRMGNNKDAGQRLGVVFLETDKRFEVEKIVNLARKMIGLQESGATEDGLRHLDRPLPELDADDSEEDHINPLSVPKYLYRYVSTADQKDALKNGITFSKVGGGIPTSTKSSIGIAVQSGAINTSKLLTITTSKIPGFKFQYVPTRSKLKEVKILCDVPKGAIS